MFPQKNIRHLRSSNCWKCTEIVNPTTTTLFLYHFKSFTIPSGGPFWLLGGGGGGTPRIPLPTGLIQNKIDQDNHATQKIACAINTDFKAAALFASSRDSRSRFQNEGNHSGKNRETPLEAKRKC